MSTPKTPSAADLKNLTAIAFAQDRFGSPVINGTVYGVPGYGDVVVQYRAMHRLGELGLVTWEAHSQTVSVYQGFRFGRLGGTKTHIQSWVTAELTPAGRAFLAAKKSA